jgi:hypothetical protein
MNLSTNILPVNNDCNNDCNEDQLLQQELEDLLQQLTYDPKVHDNVS